MEEKMEEKTTEKPQIGTWANLKGYPDKISFELERPVLVVFPASFKEPVEMPNTRGEGVYYLFNVLNGQGKEASIMTSSWTLLTSLKTQEPLAGKSLIITKKSANGKTMDYVTKPESFGAPEISEAEHKVIDEQVKKQEESKIIQKDIVDDIQDY